MKKFLAFLMGLAFVYVSMPARAQQYGQFGYSTDRDSVTITSYDGSEGIVTIPSEINGLPVTSIGVGAFASRALQSITISAGVKSIGSWAFYDCSVLTNVTVLGSITNVEAGAFALCENLTTIELPDTLIAIGYEAFVSCRHLRTIAIPKDVTTIGERAFFECVSLTGVTIPQGVVDVGSQAFSGCTSLMDIAVAPSNKWFSSVDGVVFNKDQTALFQYPNGRGGDYTIPYGVSRIVKGAFAYCHKITSVTIPETVTNIECWAFPYTSLKTISVDVSNAFYSSVDGVLFTKDQTKLVQFPGGRVGRYTIPISVTSVEDYAFAGCVGLNNIMLSGSITNVGTDAFQNCQSLTDVAIPEGVITIGYAAFSYCSGLTNIVIPGTVTSLYSVCYGCTNLMSITVVASNEYYSSLDGVLFDKKRTTLLQYPTGRIGNYAIPSGVTTIMESAFAYCLGLTGVTIPNGVASIRYQAFMDCSALTTISIPHSVTDIESYAFERCINLVGIYFQGNAPKVGELSFANPVVYYLPGTTGWDPKLGGLATMLWNPVIRSGSSIGISERGRVFSIVGAENLAFVVESCTNLATASWIPLQTNTIAGGEFHFTDPEWKSHPARFYRVRSP